MKIKVSNYIQSKNVFHAVSSGETIEEIANVYGVPKDYIKKNNPGELYVGKVLFLPETNFSSYVAKPFETLDKIAKINGISVEQLRLKNNLESDYVFVGQKLYI